MRIVLLSSTFNGLTQRAYAELAEDGHTVSVCIAADDAEIRARIHDAKPDLILCPMLTRPVPAEIWRRFTTLIVHPGIPGDRGPSALDWAILRGLETWGVTVLQADAAMDAGPIWSRATFPMRRATKSSIYRREVTDTAMACLRDAVGKAQDPHFRPQPLAEVDSSVAGQWNDAMRQTDRAISWTTDSTACVCRKIRSADGHPGVLDTVRGVRCYLYGAHPADGLRGTPGEVLGVRGGAICIATTDGAVWITHVRRKADKPTDTFKLPATTALADVLADAPVLGRDVAAPCHAEGLDEIQYTEADGVGYLTFAFHNGAMNTDQCRQLRDAFRAALRRPTRVVVLLGGPDIWSNGIHLNMIEAAADPAQESWENIVAMDDLVHAIATTQSHIVVSALRGNAGAGGAMMALAADEVWAASGVVLNPHYKALGGLYGSEYWTYLLPRRVGDGAAERLTEACKPVGTAEALRLGLVDAVLPSRRSSELMPAIHDRAVALGRDPDHDARLASKRAMRAHAEAAMPLARYREAELDMMWRSFADPDSAYHAARSAFVRKTPPCGTPERLVEPHHGGVVLAPASADAKPNVEAPPRETVA